ncbi:MAG: hypothetical protein P8Y03_25755 [Anaerolineales bacterium]
MITLISTPERVFTENRSSSPHGLLEIDSLRHADRPKLFSDGSIPVSGQPPSILQPESCNVHPQSPTFNFQPSNLQPLAFVPQTTNVEISAITNNSPRRLALKSQESYLFLEKPILNLFLLKNQQSFHSSIAESCA